MFSQSQRGPLVRLVCAFNQEKALVGAFSMILQLHRLTDLRHYAGAQPFPHFSADTLNTGHILAGILPAALRHIENNQTTTMQIAAERSRLFSSPPGAKLIIFLKRDFQTHLFVSNACFMCLFVCFKTYTATHSLGSPFPGISSLF